MVSTSGARAAHSLLRSANQPSSAKSALQSAITLSKTIYAELNQSPILVFANMQLGTAKRVYNSESLLVDRLRLLFQLCKSNHYNTLAATNMGVGLALVFVTETSDKKQTLILRKQLLRHLEKVQWSIAADVLRLSTLLSRPGSYRYNGKLRLSQWQWMALWSTQLVAPEWTQSWPDRLSLVIRNSPYWTQSTIETLLVFPGLLPPATVISIKDSPCYVLRQTHNQVWFYDGNDTKSCAIDKLKCTYSKSVKAGQIAEQVDTLPEDGIYPLSFKVEKPPKSLLRVLNYLNLPRIEIDKLAELVEADSSFSGFVQEAASQSNRLQLPVTSVKQAIMTYGTERLGDMLVTHALYKRLAQHEFPLKSDIVLHVDVVMALLGELAVVTKQMSPQTASLLGLLAHVGLFTDQGLKTQTNWAMVTTEQPLQMQHTINGISADTLKVSAVKLAKSWALSPRLIAQLGRIFDQTVKRQTASAVIFDLAVHWALSAKRGVLRYHSLSHYEKKQLTSLGLDTKYKQMCLETVSHKLMCSLIKH